ncbi:MULTISPECIES: hypothetical protein [Nostoc cyanobionts]|nr:MULTISPECIES: hypothetical protein [unclassified Nostoc]
MILSALGKFDVQFAASNFRCRLSDRLRSAFRMKLGVSPQHIYLQ